MVRDPLATFYRSHLLVSEFGVLSVRRLQIVPQLLRLYFVGHFLGFDLPLEQFFVLFKSLDLKGERPVLALAIGISVRGAQAFDFLLEFLVRRYELK